ncbi:protein NO VEIN domain-containing protein [Nocardioides ochotonae]|uniref:protein NO VEIN domain-containing protein n=1 Tax=Nocardioides ochotonae TaxID=2685869 RepID=UPI0014072C59|nr:DUF3883 domain-containing protein [Nocardioides ochotonae]
MIRGSSIPRPGKEALARALAAELNLPAPPRLSEGSTVESEFLGRVFRAIAGREAIGTAYRKTEAILAHLGRTYDGSWDTSENAPTGGGSTVTVRAYSQMLSACTGRDRCFIVPRLLRDWRTMPLPVGGLLHQRTLAEAGPGSRIVFADRHSGAFTATATVRYVHGSARGAPWTVDLYDYRPFDVPLRQDDIHITGWDIRAAAITEIPRASFDDILTEAFPRGMVVTVDADEIAGTDDEVDETSPDPGGRVTARRAREAFDSSREHQILDLPTLPSGQIAGVPPRPAQYVDDGDYLRPTRGNGRGRRAQRDPARDRDAEVIAVQTTIKAFEDGGWELTADRQSDGVGYDLEFSREGTTLHVEVKGIIGTALTFNLTAKENWRAENDPQWVLAAVTSVLTNGVRCLHTLSRDRVVTANRIITGYRVTL